MPPAAAAPTVWVPVPTITAVVESPSPAAVLRTEPSTLRSKRPASVCPVAATTFWIAWIVPVAELAWLTADTQFDAKTTARNVLPESVAVVA